MKQPLVFYGTLIHSASLEAVEILEKAAVIVDTDGRIAAVHKNVAADDAVLQMAGAQVHRLGAGDFLMPGLVDTHNHAPQWSMRGLGQGLHILDWLEQVTFPHEARFQDAAYARRVYESCVAGFLRQGITTASYYGSKHAEATQILADVCVAQGQRAFVGKCNMDRNAPDYLRDESAAVSLAETEACIRHVRAAGARGEAGGRERVPVPDSASDLAPVPASSSSLVRPVLTPRFAICCTPELLRGLGALAAADPQLTVQTHFHEAEQEVQATRELFPGFASEADLYDSFGLMGPRTILAHCTIMGDYDLERVRALGCGVAHCPVSNMTVGGGFMAAPVRAFLRAGIKVGLGTDSGGGFSSSLLDAMRQALIASNARGVASGGVDKALSLDEVFYLGTLGGARVCCLDNEIGSFAVGKQFDAVWVTSAADGAMTMYEDGDDSPRRLFDKFIMTGDDRNMPRVYVRGRLVKGMSE